MDKSIAQILCLPEEAEKILIGTLYDISVDDGKNNDLSIPDEWTLKRFIEAGLVRDVKAEETDLTQYPYIINERVVFSDKPALNLDNIAASYQATKKRGHLIPVNDTLSTIDSLYIKEKDVWWLLEFKNGDWSARDIKKKVDETLRLLGNLELLDNNAVLTTNREEQTVEVRELNLKAKLESEFDFHADIDFYKSRVSLYIVYTDHIRKAREFLKFCSQKSIYADMDAVFKQYGIFRKKIASPAVEMGYEQINTLAAYLLQATTENHYYQVYHNVGLMYSRWKEMSKASYQKYPALLNGMPVFVSEVPGLLPGKSRRRFPDNISSPDEFLIWFAVCSIWHVREEDTPECKEDEYDVIMGILDCILQEDHSGYVRECRDIVEQFGALLCADEKRRASVCREGFTDNLQSLFETDFDEALGRILLVQRVTNRRGCYCLTRKQQEELLRNILHIEVKEVDPILDIVNDNMESFLKFVALKSYFSKKYTCFWNPGQDDYMHICRQIYYIKELYEEKMTTGENAKKHGSQKMRTYGCFGTLLNCLMTNEPSAGFQEKVKEKVNQIEKKILEGKSRMEIQPLQMAVQETISSKTIALQQLKYSFEGALFKRVAGCKGEDFDIQLLHSCGQ